MIGDVLTGHRIESTWVDVLTLQDVPVGRLDGVEAASVDWNVNATIRATGRLTYVGEPVNWNQVRLQPWYRAESGGHEFERPLGVFIPASPGTTYTHTGASVELELYDKTDILERDQSAETYQVDAGTHVVPHVRAMLQAVGESRIAIDDSDQVLRSAIVWQAGTSKLRIINDLLESINYFSIWVDGYGVFRSSPYRRPSARSVELDLVDGKDAIYSPDLMHDFDTYEVANKVVCVSQSDGEAPALIAVATDTDPDSAFSYPVRRRWVTRFEDNVQAADEQTLQAIADRYLAEGQQVGSKWSLKCAHVGVELNDVVRLASRQWGIEAVGSVQTLAWRMGQPLLDVTIREVKA